MENKYRKNDFCLFCGSLIEKNNIELRNIPCCLRRFSSESFTIWNCQVCGSIHAYEKVNLSRYYENFPLHNQKMNLYLTTIFKKRLKLLKSLGFNKDSFLLDYGCGSGLFLDFLKEKGHSKCFGYDPFSNIFSDSSILEKKFNFVTSQDVIEHSDTPIDELLIVRKILKPNGIYIVGTPRAEGINLDTPWAYLVYIGQPYHRHIFSERALNQFVSAHGFSEICTNSIFNYDSILPGTNERFILEYLNHFHGYLEIAVEPPKLGQIFLSPKLVFFAFFGKFFNPRTSMIKIFCKA